MTKQNTWWHNKKINPVTRRKIKKGGKVYKSYLKDCLINGHVKDNYSKYHSIKVDPLLNMSLPLVRSKPLFKFEYCWEPLDGEILGRDPRGPLYFDPDTLIHYFYTNRLKYLWVEGDNYYSGSYGDALGNGPYFNIPGRGISLHYYLFRLPLPDAYCDNLNIQQITIGPILTYENVLRIDFLAKQYGNNYKEKFGIERPDILLIYKLYHEAINKIEVDENLMRELNLTNEEIENNRHLSNRIAVDKLKNI
tara:strand:- start:753 stop:1502 length:750 start_codon:yes stop_codon:yes gene_type:complete